MSTELQRRVAAVPPRRLWFGSVASVAAWLALGCLDILINWRACMHQENFGIPPAHSSARIAFSVLALVLLLIALAAGFTSYKNWRALSLQNSLLNSEAVERHEFMAAIGVIISITLGVGIILLAIPPFFLDICWRAR